MPTDPKAKPAVPYELKKIDERQRGNSVIITAFIPVNEGVTIQEALARGNSVALKNEIFGRRAEFALAAYGVQKTSGVVPIRDAKDSSKVLGYEVDFRFTPTL